MDDVSGRCFERDQSVGVEIGAMAATNEVSRADEIRDKGAIRQPVDFVGRPGLLDQPVTHHDDAVRHRQRFFQVVGHVNAR